MTDGVNGEEAGSGERGWVMGRAKLKEDSETRSRECARWSMSGMRYESGEGRGACGVGVHCMYV